MQDLRPLLGSGALVLGALALTESFALLLPGLAAYGSAWWLLRLERVR